MGNIIALGEVRVDKFTLEIFVLKAP